MLTRSIIAQENKYKAQPFNMTVNTVMLWPYISIYTCILF